jgi:hypothetical protein
MKTPRIVIATFAAAVLVAGACLAQAPAPANDAAPAATTPVKVQTTCPVMGGAVNKKLFVDAEGKRIYLCCGGCIKTVQKDPAKYIKMLEDKGVTLEKTPAPAAEPVKAPAAAQ